MTKIVGSKVKINALITIIGAVLGGTFIGLSGIFRALPAVAIFKIIFDRTEDLKPRGMLMGHEKYSQGKLYLRIKKFRKKRIAPITTANNSVSNKI